MFGRFFLLFFFVASLSAKPLKVEVSAPSAILMNAETGAILYTKNIHDRQYPASVTKIATALYILEKKGHELGEKAKVSAHAIKTVHAYARQVPNSPHPSYRLEHDGTMMWIRSGEILTLNDLLHGLMLCSGNDAANVLAEHVSGSIELFVDEVNQYLLEHGIKETHFTNPHGLYHYEHWTTAYDMAQMTRLALKNAAFCDIVKKVKYQCPATNLQPARQINQNNRLVKPNSPQYYPKAIGVKTGYVAKAGYTFVGAAEHEGRTLIAVLLNSPESSHRFRDAVKLFEAAFREKPVVRTLFAKESDKFTRQVRGAKSPIEAVLKEDLVLNYFPAEEPVFQAEIAWNKNEFPKAGQNVGSLRLVSEGKLLRELPIFAVHDVDQKWWSAIGSFCISHKVMLLALFLSSQVVLLLFYLLRKNQKVS